MDLSYANPHDGPPADVLAVLRRVAGECGGLSLQYTPYGGRTPTRCAVAARLIREYGLPFHYRDIIMTTGAMAGALAVNPTKTEPAGSPTAVSGRPVGMGS